MEVTDPFDPPPSSIFNISRVDVEKEGNIDFKESFSQQEIEDHFESIKEMTAGFEDEELPEMETENENKSVAFQRNQENVSEKFNRVLHLQNFKKKSLFLEDTLNMELFRYNSQLRLMFEETEEEKESRRIEGMHLNEEALRYLFGNQNIEKNEQKAKILFEEAAKKGNDTAFLHLGLLHLFGIGIKKDDKEARNLFQESASRGNVEALSWLAKMYLFGKGGEKDAERAILFFREAEKKGNLDAVKFLAQIYKSRNDLCEATKLMLKHAEKAREISLKKISNSIFSSSNSNREICKYEENVEFGIGNLVDMYSVIMKKSRIDFAIYNLGKKMLGKEGTNFSNAIEILEIASNRGDSESMNLLGSLLVNSDMPDYDRAEKLFDVAIDKGNRKAVYNKGVLFEFGFGVPKDVVLAYRYYVRADSLGVLEAKEGLRRLGASTKMEEREDGKKYWVTTLKGGVKVDVQRSWQTLTLMCIGNESAGKTTFATRLSNGYMSTRSDHSITHGVDLYEWIDEKNKFHFNIFDFAGHEEWYFSHSFFFTKKCVYLLVINLELEDWMEENSVLYWLHFLQSRTSGEMRLLVVCTHADKIKKYAEKLEEIKNKLSLVIQEHRFSFEFDIRKDVFAVGSRSLFFSRQLEDLRHHLLTDVAPQAQQRLCLTNSHRIVFEILSNFSNSIFVTFSELQNRVDFELKEKLKSVLLDLCSTGCLVYFDDDGPLSKFIIKDIKWINNVFKQILSLNNGNKCDFYWKEIWPLIRDNTFADFNKFPKSTHLVTFVKKVLIHFDIILPIDNLGNEENERFLLPILLREKISLITCNSISAYRQNSNSSFIRRTYRMKFKPAGLFQRIFVRIRTLLNYSELYSELSREKLLIAEKLGEIVQESISNELYHLEFKHWSIKTKMKRNSCANFSVDQSEREIGVQMHELTVLITCHASSSSSDDFEVASSILSLIAREIQFFRDIWFPSLAFVHSETDQLSGWKKGTVSTVHKQPLYLLSHPTFDGNVICKICKMETKLRFQHQECENCLHPLLLYDRFAVLSQLLVDSAQANIFHAYDFQIKKQIAVKERKKNDSDSERIFDREVSILRQLSELSEKRNKDYLLGFVERRDKFLFVEWIEGSTLEGVEWSVNDRLVKMCISVLQSLALLHDNLLVHQDLNQSNILFDRNRERFVLIDFGTVIRQQKSNLEDDIFRSFGKETFRFLVSPEQNKGFPTTKSDLFSLGKLCKYFQEKQEKKQKPIFVPFALQKAIKNMCRETFNEKIFENAREVLLFLKIELKKENNDFSSFEIPEEVFLSF